MANHVSQTQLAGVDLPEWMTIPWSSWEPSQAGNTTLEPDQTRDEGPWQQDVNLRTLQCQYCHRPFLLQDERLGSLDAARLALERHEERCGAKHCQHCCRMFKSALECRGHIAICASDPAGKTRCQFCTKRFVNAVEVRSHEASCDLNPDCFCDYCNGKFGHKAVRDRHLRHCPKHPMRTCKYCATSFKTFHEATTHEVFCIRNPASMADLAECVACNARQPCVRFPCGEHFYCACCILKMAHTGMKDRSLIPLRCCRQNVQPGDVVDIAVCQLLPEALRRKYQEEMLAKVSKNLMYCPRVACGCLIVLDFLDEYAATDGGDVDVSVVSRRQSVPATARRMNLLGVHACPNCEQALCFNCRSEWHEGMSCKQYQFFVQKDCEDVIKLCRKMNWMRCFECGYIVEKKAGCNHISCRCGAQFCYLCGGRWGDCRCQIISDGHALRHNRAPGDVQIRNICPHCQQQFDSPEELQVHVQLCRVGRVHRAEQLCPYCGEPAASRQWLRSHLRGCNGVVRPRQGVFQCSMCLTIVATGYDLRRHIRRCLALG